MPPIPRTGTKALEEINTSVERLRAWENVLQNEIATCGAELSKLESTSRLRSPPTIRGFH